MARGYHQAGATGESKAHKARLCGIHTVDTPHGLRPRSVGLSQDLGRASTGTQLTVWCCPQLESPPHAWIRSKPSFLSYSLGSSIANKKEPACSAEYQLRTVNLSGMAHMM